MTILNLAVGNTDNHAKNHALIYRGNTPELAPLYDVIPVLLHRNVTHEFGFKFGNAAEMEDHHRHSLWSGE
jgi:serine/threonine-protein kinase HipA